MNIQEKLSVILTLSGWTQQTLAQELHVSFATVNSWIHGKSKPHKGALERIDALFLKLTGITNLKDDVLSTKKKIILKKSKNKGKLIDIIFSRPDIHDQLVLSFTYHTNRIEGSTLTEPETAALLFEDMALSNKKMTEQLEVKNHQVAIEFAFQVIKDKKSVDEKLILKLHSMLMNGIRDDAGRYRNHAIRIVGANVPTANPLSVPAKMKQLIGDMKKPTKDPVAHISKNHAVFEQIHPFSDGNGRIGRLIMLIMLLQQNIAPAVVRQEKKQHYYKALQRAQQKQEYEPLETFVCNAILGGYRILL